MAATIGHVRCSKCRARQRLAGPPESYRRLPRCKGCGRKMTAFPVRPSEPHYYVDRYRAVHEVGPKRPRPCNCYGYSFPHAKGRGWCDHNPRLTAEDLRQRHEGGSYA